MPRFIGTDENDHSVEDEIKHYVATGHVDDDDDDADVLDLVQCKMPSNVGELASVHTIKWQPYMAGNTTSIGKDLQLPPRVHALKVTLMSTADAVQHIEGTFSADSVMRIVHLSFDATDCDGGPLLEFAPLFLANRVMVALETLYIDHCRIHRSIRHFSAPRLTTLRCGPTLKKAVTYGPTTTTTFWEQFTKFPCLRVIEVPWRALSIAKSDLGKVLWEWNRDERLWSLSLAPPRNPEGDTEPLVLPWSYSNQRMWKRRRSTLKLDVYLTLFLSLLERKKPIADDAELEQLRLNTYILDEWAYSRIPVDAARATALLGKLEALGKPASPLPPPLPAPAPPTSSSSSAGRVAAESMALVPTSRPMRRQRHSGRSPRTPMTIVSNALSDLIDYYFSRRSDDGGDDADRA